MIDNPKYNSSDVIETRLEVTAENCQQKASLLLANNTSLSQEKIKDAMSKGAVWLLRKNKQGVSKQRLRRASKKLQAGDVLEINYNPQILNQTVPEPELVFDGKDYSVWFKPYGLYCQGSRWGDFASINRWVEVNLPALIEGNERPVFLVHRLDRATSGLILLCHSKNAARLFSEMFRAGKIDKRYQAIVHGDFSQLPQPCEVNEPVDEKAARSVFSFSSGKEGLSLLDVKLVTGRKHQIRKHLSGLGFPIVGDRLYGLSKSKEAIPKTQKAVDSERDLQLQSVSLRFRCPFSKEEQFIEVATDKRLAL